MRRWQINSSNTCWAVICTPSSSLLNTKVKETRIRKLTTHLFLALHFLFEDFCLHWALCKRGPLPVTTNLQEQERKSRYLPILNRWRLALAILPAFESSFATSNKLAYNFQPIHQWSLLQYFAETLGAVWKCSAEPSTASVQQCSTLSHSRMSRADRLKDTSL